MASSSNFQASFNPGDWKKEILEDGRVQLYREVKIGGSTYKIDVKYNEKLANYIDQSDQPLDSTIKRVIQESEQKINDLIAALERESQPIEKVTLKTDLVKRTSTVSMRSLRMEEGTVPAEKLQDKNISLKNAASGLIQFVAGRCINRSKETDPFTVLFVDKKPTTLVPFKKKAARQLESIFAVMEKGGRPEPDEHGVKRWPKFRVEGHEVEVKEFEEGAYNGPVMEDFRRRQQLVYRAASAFLNDNAENVENFGKVTQALVKLDLKFQKEYQLTQCRLDYSKMKTGIDATDYYLEVNERQVDLISQFARDAQEVINESLSTGEFTIQDIDAWERKEVMRRGRPIVVNIFTINGQKFFSMQTPEAKDSNGRKRPTLPSTLRDRPGLVNYVSTTFGTISDDQQINVDHYAVRHSSYGPIAVKDACLRQAHAVKNVKQLMTDLAAVALEEEERGDSPDDPLIIPLRTMMLLTPLSGDQYYRSRKKFVAGEWTGESESQQLKESTLALITMRGRVVPLRIKGKKVYVKLESSFMNLGANKEAAKMGAGKIIPISSYEGEINPRGYFRFIGDIEKHLLQREMPEVCNGWLKNIIKEERKAPGYQLKHKELQDAINKSRGPLNTKKEELETLYESYEFSGDPQLAKAIETARDELVQMEKDLNHLFGELYKLRLKALNRNQSSIQAYQENILHKLGEEIEEAKDLSKKQELVQVRDIFENYFQAKEIYQSRAYRQQETVMQFQALYLQTYEMIGYMTEFFCKSAEDRTGRVDNKVQERFAFNALHKRQASSSAEDKKAVEEELAPVIHQYSASRDNTRLNSDSPGLQITHHVNPTLTAKIDHANATMAKRVISKAKKLHPSEYH